MKELLQNPGIRPVFIYKLLRSVDGTSAKLVQATKKEGFATIETGRYEVDGESVVCISTQIGCAMGCIFCRSTEPFEFYPGRHRRILRNLDATEIVAQALNSIEVIPPPPGSKGIIFSYMGMGEPFANIKAVKDSVIYLGNLFRENSRATLSTVGFNLRAIYHLADEIKEGKFPIRVKLHISLNGSSDDQRKKVFPYPKPLEDTIKAAEYFFSRTDSIVKLNYVLVKGVNDSDEDAERIGWLLRNRSGLILKIADLNSDEINLIVSKEDADRFEQSVRNFGVETCRFTSHGRDIKIGCGELVKGKISS